MEDLFPKAADAMGVPVPAPVPVGVARPSKAANADMTLGCVDVGNVGDDVDEPDTELGKADDAGVDADTDAAASLDRIIAAEGSVANDKATP